MFSIYIGYALIPAPGLLMQSPHRCTVQIPNVNIHFEKACLSEEIKYDGFMKHCFHINRTPTVADNRGSIGQFNNAESK